MHTDPIGYMQAKDQYERLVAHTQYIRQQMDLGKQKAEQETQQLGCHPDTHADQDEEDDRQVLLNVHGRGLSD